MADMVAGMKQWGLFIGILIFALAACGGAPESKPAEASPPGGADIPIAESESKASELGDTPDPCTLLSGADIERVTGMPVGEVEGPKAPDSDPNGLICHFTEPDHTSGPARPRDYIAVAVYSKSDHCEMLKQGFAGSPMAGLPQDGIGSAATYYDLGTNQNICVENGSTPFTVFSLIDSRPVSREALAELARIVLSNM